MFTCRYKDEVKQYEDTIKRIQFKKEAKNLFSAPSKSKQDVSLEQNTSDFLSPPVRPTMRLIPSWDSVLSTLEARLQTEFMKLEKWWFQFIDSTHTEDFWADKRDIPLRRPRCTGHFSTCHFWVWVQEYRARLAFSSVCILESGRINLSST